MKVLKTVAEVREWREALNGHSLGFVPTMGALHQGHSRLLQEARKEDFVILSIFVNPTQFNDPNDLKNYPRPLERDLLLASQAGVNAVWVPGVEDLYPEGFRFSIHEKGLSEKFCGSFRPGHFDGMLTVVMKLLQAVRPDRAYFGEKDWQQLLLVKDLCRAFFLPVQIVPVATVRETDGLALSSRNVRLSEKDRPLAPKLYEILSTSATAEEAKDELNRAGFRVEYVEDFNHRRLAAAWLGPVRLIDNVELR